MRRKLNRQTNLFTAVSSNPIARELKEISKIIDANPGVLDLVYQDLVRAKRHDTGREGLTAEQVLRCCILKQYRELSYEELAFHLEDSSAFRTFSRLEMGQYPCKSILQENIKSLSEETWEAIHSQIIDYAQEREDRDGPEDPDRLDGDRDRHPPSDGFDAALRRHPGDYPLAGCRQGAFSPPRLSFFRPYESGQETTDGHPQHPEREGPACRLPGTAFVCTAGWSSMPKPRSRRSGHIKERMRLPPVLWRDNLERAVGILRKVIDQTVRRVIKGEKVPASEKVVSFFEEHTDIIVKRRRDTQFGHKVFLTGGASNLILDCLIERGNPADSDRYQDLLERHKEQFGRAPRQVSADGGFASRKNLVFAKGRKVKDAVFAKKRGLTVIEMAKSAWVYKMLRNFRAGIEAGISTLKRAFGLDRCKWSGWGGFKQYVWSSIVSYNLLVMARIRLAKA